jgi:hypothetical protein
MRKLGIAIGLLLVVLMAAILAVPECRLTISGYIRGEHLFKGRPTSYWRYEVEKYVSWCEHPRRPARSLWGKFLEYFSWGGWGNRPDVLWGNPKAVPVLIDLTKERTNRGLYVQAYNTLSALGPSASDAIPSLIEDVNDEDIYRSTCALNVLPHLGPDGVPILIGALKDDRPQIRAQAALDIARVEPPARDAIPALVEALQDEEEGVRTWAAMALKRIDPEEAKKAGAEKFIPPPIEGPSVPATSTEASPAP